MASSHFINVILPSVLLLALSITAFFNVLKGIPTTATQKGIWLNATEFCPVLFENSPFLKVFQDGGSFGILICTITGIFEVNIQYGNSLRPGLLYGLYFLGVLASFAFFETARSSRPYPKGTFVIITSITQILTGAVTLPFYWILFLWVEHKEEIPSPFSLVDAKVAVTAILSGYFLPTILFAAFPGSIWLNFLWQIFPLVILISVRLSRLVFGKSSTSNASNQETQLTGNKLIERFYLVAAILGAIIHFIVFRFSFAGLILRSIADLDPSKGDTFQTSAGVFLQWDILFISLGAVLSLLWVVWTRGTLAESQKVKTLVWFALATPLIGIATALAGIFYFREQGIARARAAKP